MIIFRKIYIFFGIMTSIDELKIRLDIAEHRIDGLKDWYVEIMWE